MPVSLVGPATLANSGGALSGAYVINPYSRRSLLAFYAGGSGAIGAPWDSRGTVVTYAGLPLVLVGQIRYQPGGPGTIDHVAEIWSLADPPLGSGTFSFATVGNANHAIALCLASGINSVTPFGAVITASGGGVTTSSLTPASSEGEVAVSALNVSNPFTTPPTPTAPTTAIGVISSGGGVPTSLGAGQRAGGALSSLTWTWAPADSFAHVAVALKPQIETIRRPVEYTYDIWEANPQVRDAAGRVVPPWQVRANRWLRILGTSQPTSERPLSFVDDSEIAYIESVRYDGESGNLSIATNRSELGEVIVARAAGKSTS